MNASVAPIAVIIVLLLAIGGVVYFMYSGAGASYWETKNEFGTWEEEILIEFEDGSTESLKILQDRQSTPLTWTKYNGQTFVEATYIMKARATGEGYGGVEVDATDLEITGDIEGAIAGQGSNFGTKNGELGERFTVAEVSLPIWAMAVGMQLEDGTYQASFDIDGSMRYRGVDPTGNWNSVSLPDDRSFNFQVVGSPYGLQISLEFTDDIDFN